MITITSKTVVDEIIIHCVVDSRDTITVTPYDRTKVRVQVTEDDQQIEIFIAMQDLEGICNGLMAMKKG